MVSVPKMLGREDRIEAFSSWFSSMEIVLDGEVKKVSIFKAKKLVKAK